MSDVPGEVVSSKDNEESNDALWKRVYQISSRIARAQFHLSHADSEEIAQEMMLRAFKKIGSASINSVWIGQGTRFLCIDRLRSRRSEEKALQTYGSEFAGRGERFGLPHLRAADLTAAIQSLPPHCRSLIWKYYWEGCTWAEVDDALGRGHRCAQYETKKCVQALAQALQVWRLVAVAADS